MKKNLNTILAAYLFLCGAIGAAFYGLMAYLHSLTAGLW